MSNNGCCKDEKKEIKISSDQQKAEYSQTLRLPIAEIIKHSFTRPSKNLFLINKPFFAYLHAPPILLKEDIQAIYSIYLI